MWAELMKSIKYAFFASCVLLASTSCATGLGKAPLAQAGLLPSVVSRAQADTVQVFAAKMNRPITTVVIVPEQYYADAGSRWPVLYLLHGAWGSYRDWPTKARLDKMATQYGMMIVCPDGQDSWYWDSPVQPDFQFETFISKELVSYIDTHYRTRATRTQRAITGLSMGGQGALWNAWRHPDVFGACGSMSGGLDITKFPDKWRMNERIGNYADNQQRWTDFSLMSLLPNLKPGQQHIIIDDGDKDFFYEVNVTMHEELLKRGIDHDFIIRPGAHSWDYWLNAIDYHLLYFQKAFAADVDKE